MNIHNQQNLGMLVLRIALGVVLLVHSLYLKLVIFTLPGTANFFVSIGLPGWLAYVVFTAEVITGTAIILGVYPRQAALAIVPILLGATWAHFPNGWLFTNAKGGWEYPLFLAVIAFALACVEPGEYVIKSVFDKNLRAQNQGEQNRNRAMANPS